MLGPETGVKIFLRERPALLRETGDQTGDHKAYRNCLSVRPQTSSIEVVPPKQNSKTNGVSTSTPRSASGTRHFQFDYVAASSASQEDMFENVGKPIVNSCLNGVNGTIFAYGQIGTGKTYTIAAGAGKTTFSRYMVTLRGYGYSAEDRLYFRKMIHFNIIKDFKLVLKEVETRWSSELSKTNENSRNILLSLMRYEQILPQIAWHMSHIWTKDSVVRNVVMTGDVVVSDSLQYFMDDAKRIGDTKYVPTDQDIARICIRSTGVDAAQVLLQQSGHTREVCCLIDVGGLRHVRNNWWTCTGIDKVIFITSLAEYNEQLHEDQQVNRMDESLEVFGQLCRSKLFEELPILLLFNKIDIFKERIKTDPLEKCFRDFDGDGYEDSLEFIKKKFLAQNTGKRTIITFPFCAIDKGYYEQLQAEVFCVFGNDIRKE